MNIWDQFFKSEIRNSGKLLYTKARVSLTRASDTEIQIFIRASSSFKVTFKSVSVESKTLTVECSCPQSKKGQFCKHIWVSLLVIAEKSPDFLELKTELQKKANPLSEPIKSKSSQIYADAQLAHKLKQTAYRKQHYQKQKQRLKDQKISKKNVVRSAEFPPDVEMALNYFTENGFFLRDTLTTAAVGLAMKKLARIFHPDLGGSHSEILELNKFTAILDKYIKS